MKQAKVLLLLAILTLALIPTSCTCNCSNEIPGGGYNPSGLGVYSTAKIAFINGSFDKFALYTINADGSELTNLTAQNDSIVFSPTWSPDGSK